MKLQNNQTSIITKDKKCTWIYAIKVVDISTLIKAHGYGQAFNEGFARRPCWMAGTRQILLSGKINIFFMQKYFIVSAIQHGQVSQAKMGKKVLVKMFSAIAWIVFLLFGLFVRIQAHASCEYFVQFLSSEFLVLPKWYNSKQRLHTPTMRRSTQRHSIDHNSHISASISKVSLNFNAWTPEVQINSLLSLVLLLHLLESGANMCSRLPIRWSVRDSSGTTHHNGQKTVTITGTGQGGTKWHNAVCQIYSVHCDE